MNIWLLTSQFPPSIIGGIARYVANATEMFAKAGHQVTVITADETDGETILEYGARVIRFVPAINVPPSAASQSQNLFPYNLLSHWPALSYEMAEQVTRLINRDGVRPDVIECQEYAALPYYLIQRRLVERHPLSSVPLLIHLHSPDFGIRRANEESRYRFPAYWVGQMEKFCIQAADGRLSPSRFLRDDVARDVPQVAGMIDVLPYPYVPLPMLEARPIPGDLVYFGRLEVRKGVIPLVQSCALLWEQGLSFTLTLIGGDTLFSPKAMQVGTFLRQRYTKWIQAGKLVIQDAPLVPPQLWQRLARAWAVVIPSVWENFPNTCIEAMSLGKLVIGSTSGGQAEMIGDDSQAGLLFDWAKPGSCAAAIERALSMSAQDVIATGARARERITAMTSFERVLPQRIAHYEKLIARTTPRTLFPCVTPGIEGNTLPPAPEEVAGLLSVVVPFYNLGAYIEETIESIAKSTYQPFEIIILDDGSDQPDSLAALERIQKGYEQLVRIVRTENAGLANARNTGAAAAHGEFLAFVDADDLVEPVFFERSIDVLRRYTNVSFVYSWVQFFGESQACWPTWNTELPYLLGHNMLTAFVVLRRSDFLAYGKNDPSLAYSLEDHDAWISMVEHGCIGVSLPDLLVHYRLRPGSMYRAMNEDQAFYLSELIAERHPELYRRYGPELFALQNANGPAARWNHPAVEVVDYRRKYEDLLAHYQGLRRKLRFIDPLISLLRRARRS